MLSPKDLKRDLRNEALARRDALDPAWRVEVSIGMAESGAKIAGVAADSVVSGFWPMRSEADIRPLMTALRERGARLCLPAILDKTTIVFRELRRETKLVSMGYGTYGPDEAADILDPSILLVPLAAFDARGHRIGYGAGYYDRAIAKLTASGRVPHLVGVAFDCQEVHDVPDEPHDMPLNEILTESGLRRFAPPL